MSPEALKTAKELIYNYPKGHKWQADLSKMSLGNSIPVYEHANNKLRNFSDAQYYPVYWGDEIIGIFALNGVVSGDLTYSFGQEWAEDINAFIDSGNTEFCLVVDGSSVFIKSPDEVTLALENPMIDLNEGVNTYKNSLSQENDITVKKNNIETVPDQNIRYQANSKIIDLDVPDVNLARSYISTTLQVEEYMQQYNTCWAVSVMVIGDFISYWRYSKNYSYDPLQICRDMGIDYDAGAQVSTAISAFKKFYNFDTESKGVLTDSQILNYVAYDDIPCYTRWNDGTRGHAVTLCGCGYEGSYVDSIIIMDSNVGYYRILRKTRTC